MTVHLPPCQFFCLFICPCFWIHPIISVMLSHVSAFPSGSESSESWSFKKHAKDVTGGKKSNTAEFNSSTPKTQKECDTLHPRNEKSLHTIRRDVLSGELHCVFSLSRLIKSCSGCYYLLMLFPTWSHFSVDLF